MDFFLRIQFMSKVYRRGSKKTGDVRFFNVACHYLKHLNVEFSFFSDYILKLSVKMESYVA